MDFNSHYVFYLLGAYGVFVASMGYLTVRALVSRKKRLQLVSELQK